MKIENLLNIKTNPKGLKNVQIYLFSINFRLLFIMVSILSFTKKHNTHSYHRVDKKGFNCLIDDSTFVLLYMSNLCIDYFLSFRKQYPINNRESNLMCKGMTSKAHFFSVIDTRINRSQNHKKWSIFPIIFRKFALK